MNCPICKDCGWICETHALEAWPCELCDGMGVACACNPDMKPPPGYVSIASTKEQRAKRDTWLHITEAEFFDQFRNYDDSKSN